MEEMKSLVERSRRRDMDAFTCLVRRFQDMALGYAYAILGSFDMAEDAVQDAFIQAWDDLPKLREPAAFPGWLKRVIFKQCDRITRRRRVPIVPLEDAIDLASDSPGPPERAEQAEVKSHVLDAVRSLPEAERTVTALFYINGYSQKDISTFLEVPVTTVNNRLHSSRKQLKERMLQMFSDELKNHTMSESFPERVKSLLNRPKPLEIEGHPVRELWDIFRGCFPDFEMIELEEIVRKKASLIPPEAMANNVHLVDDQRILRPEITSQLVDRWLQTSRMPCKWIAAGRTFRQVGAETPMRLEAFHQAEVFWVGEGIGQQQLMEAVIQAASCLVPEIEPIIRDKSDQYPFMRCSRDFYFPWQDDLLDFGGGGVGNEELLKRGGLDPGRFGSVHFAFGLERCAMVKYDLEDARKLWQPPYV